MKIAWKKTLSTNGSTRATAYAMSNKIITADGKVFVAWLDRVADAQIRTYHIDADRWDAPVLLGQGVDNHSGPGITMDSEGYLYALFGPHCGVFQFRKSVRPCDAGEWTPVERFGEHDTYPGLVCNVDDTLHLTCRGEEPPRKALYRRRPGNGDWSAALALVDSAVPDGYTQYGSTFAIAPDGTIHFGFHIFDMHPEAGKAIGYLRSRDGGETWETATGVRVEVPVTPETECFIEQGPALDMRVGGPVLDGSGRPWLLAAHLENSPQSTTLWHLDGDEWHGQDLLAVVRNAFPQVAVLGGTMTFDAEDMIYIALTTIRHGITGKKTDTPGIFVNKWFGNASCEIVLATSADFGKTFEVIPISEVDAKTTNWLPSIERPYGPKPIDTPALIYTHGGPGAGLTEGDPTEVVFVRLEQS